ncbi:ATP-binding cassette domain-containing protein [Asticcacaulis sp. YBE204]|uniref:ATP-binding cassette domain-containing protein n=1 Tax=Asticcacaulis sp. YBE204 TaxID=1282363 RepID=UPI0003C40A2F|nr:ATP-binding cassette domain-containing protein [Asticcacaulis sp. YBE204]ESQ79810.1 hypothetical protein AEYBE204_08165 [Asticcacaulis sp. YBE204]
MSAFKTFFGGVKASFRTTLIVASLCAAGVSVAAVTLLGLSGWFLAGAAIAGAAGSAVMQAFNYLLPSTAIRALAIARTALRYFERYLGHAAALRALADLRPWLFERLTRADPKLALSLSRGEASARLVQDVGQLEGALVAQSNWASALGGLIAAVLLNLFLSPLAAVICIAGLTALVAVTHYRFRPQTGAGQAELGQLKQGLFDTLPFLPDIAAYNLKGRFLDGLRPQETALKAARVAQARREGVPAALTLLIMAATLILIVVTHVASPMPMLALSLLVTTVAFESTGPLLRAMTQQTLFGEAETRVAELGDLPEAAPLPNTDPVLVYDGQVIALDRTLRLRIDGRSGGGKTRLIEALIGLRPVDDVPYLGAATTADARLFALYPQDAPVLNSTVGDNLLMGVTAEEIADTSPNDLTARVWAALEAAQLKTRVAAMKDGLHTWIGDGGITLSGGERKRLSLARALLRTAPILVLDEPTEGLDPATEAAVVTAIEAHLSATGQGLILISHRMAPRKLCPNVLVIK